MENTAKIQKGLLYEYTNILTGAAKNFSNAYFSGGPINNNKTALNVIRYAVEIFLHWTPQEVKNYLNENVIDKMKLKRVLAYISFPPGLDPNKDYWYISHMLYPKEIPFSTEQVTIFVYERLLRGLEANQSVRFPKFMFDNYDGKKRAEACFRYLLSHYESFETIEDMYRFFSTYQGEQELTKYGLTLAWKNVYSSPVIFLHESLPKEQRNELFFHYYEFQYRYRETTNNRKRIRTISDFEKHNLMLDEAKAEYRKAKN